jgi:hypothetical protein
VTGASIYLELAPIFPGFDRRAMEVCALDAERLRRGGCRPRSLGAPDGRSSASRRRGRASGRASSDNNAVFDWSTSRTTTRIFGLETRSVIKGLDTKSLAMGVLGIPWNDTSKENLERLLALPPQDAAKIHRADYDAENTRPLILIRPPRARAFLTPRGAAGVVSPRRFRLCPP